MAGPPTIRSSGLQPRKIERRYEKAGLSTRYWTPDVHVAAFALPNYISELVEALADYNRSSLGKCATEAAEGVERRAHVVAGGDEFGAAHAAWAALPPRGWLGALACIAPRIG